MNRKIKSYTWGLVLFFIFLPGIVMAQRTAGQLLHGIYLKMNNAKDYTADVNIKIDLPFIRMLPVDAQIYYKQPGKFKVKSKGIAILPKQGFSDFSKTIEDTNSYTAVISGRENVSMIMATIINIIPSADTGDLIFGKLWVDTEKNIVLKSQLTTKSNGTLFIEYFYRSQVYYGLPDSVIFTVDVKKFKIPKGVTADINNSGSSENAPGKTSKKGKIYITIRNYSVNKGLPDSVFAN